MDKPARMPERGPANPSPGAAPRAAIRCAICLKEVPADALNVADAQDYVHHFCGLDCLDLWRKQARTGRPETAKP